MSWTLTNLQEAITTKEFTGDWQGINLNNVINDSRIYNYHGIFADFSNNIKYIEQAISNGCNAVLTSKFFHSLNIPQIIVLNVQDTIREMCHYKLKRVKPLIVGITGSVGKTTLTKELTKFFTTKYGVLTNFRNYNTEIGILCTLSMLNESHKIVFLEMGINKPGEMIRLHNIVSPEIAICTNVLTAHDANFHNYEQLVEEKMKIFHKDNTKLFILPRTLEKYTKHITRLNSLLFIEENGTYKNNLPLLNNDYVNEFLFSCSYIIENYLLSISI